MTKEEIENKYTMLCANVGETFLRIQNLQGKLEMHLKEVAELKKQFDELDKASVAVNEASKQAN